MRKALGTRPNPQSLANSDLFTLVGSYFLKFLPPPKQLMGSKHSMCRFVLEISYSNCNNGDGDGSDDPWDGHDDGGGCCSSIENLLCLPVRLRSLSKLMML